VPWFAEPVRLHEKYRGGFGVDYEVWCWSIFGTLMARAESLSHDDDAMKKVDNASVTFKEIDPARRAFVVAQAEKLKEKAKKRREKGQGH
jgi:hypothetical protein